MLTTLIRSLFDICDKNCCSPRLDQTRWTDATTVACVDLREHLADLRPHGESSQLGGQVLLQRLMALCGAPLELRMDVLWKVADQDVRHAHILLALLKGRQWAGRIREPISYTRRRLRLGHTGSVTEAIAFTEPHWQLVS